MKLLCSKCKKVLTRDLYPVSVKWGTSIFGRKIVVNTSDVFDITGEFPTECKVKSGLFFLTKGEPAHSNKWDDQYPAIIIPKTKPSLVVSRNSILDGIIPKFKPGYGCCDYSMGETLSCSCGNTLGDMFLDCYEDGSVQFNTKNVDRHYS